MIRRLLAMLAATTLALTTLAAVTATPAAASTAAPAAGLTYGAPVASLVDRHGTSFVLVQNGLFYPVLYRRASGGHSWVKTRIPNMPAFMKWHMFAPTANELWITAQEQASDGNDGNSIVSRSTDGGKTWTKADVSKFANGGSLGISNMAIIGNLVAYAHFSNGTSSHIRLHPNLKGYDAWPAGVPTYPSGAGVAGNGTLMTWSYASANAWSVTAGTHTVTVSFPCALSSPFTGPVTAIGSSALAIVGVCNSSTHHVYVRRVSTAGVVGETTSLGASSGTALAAAGAGNAFAVAWALPTNGDWASAHSTAGQTWTRTKGELPVALGGTHGGNTGTFLVGNRYLAFGTDDTKSWTTPLSATATPPAAPKRGVQNPLTLRNGTGVAVTAKKVRAGHTVTITLHLHSGGTVIGGSGGSELPLTDVKRGDIITFSVTTRNGTVHGAGKVR